MRPRLTVALLLLLWVAAPSGQTPTLTLAHEARSLQPGEVVVLTITSTTALSSISVKAFDRTERVQAVPPTADRPHVWMAVIGIDLDVKPGIHRVSVSATGPAGPTSATHTLAVTEKSFPTRRLTVDPNFVNPPASESARIQKEAVALNALWKGTNGPDPATDLGFVAPVPQKANSAFGTRSIFNGEPRSAHGGADFLSPKGTPLKAPAPGTVVLAEDLYYTGGTVVIDHGLGVISLFAHLSRIDAKVGTQAARGDVLGLVGATGRVTGAHLHWTVRINGARVDPLSLMAALPGNPSR